MASAAVIGFEDVRAAVSWRRAHAELVRLSAKRAGLDFEEGRWLLRAFRSGAHLELGYGSFQEYTERLFGYGARPTPEKLRVAEALEALPNTAEELKAGPSASPRCGSSRVSQSQRPSGSGSERRGG